MPEQAGASVRERCNSLWIGPSLGLVERACLRSVLRQGHPVSLYCYREPEGVPDGVELRDAAEIVPEDRIIRHHTGSVALFSNWFRYELQRRGRGIWIDCDVYLLAPLASSQGYLVGEEEPGRVNTGVLRFPPDSPLIAPLIALFEEREVPPWLPWRASIAARWRLRTSGRSGLARMPWGSAGPQALTALMRRFGLLGLALPADVLNPVHYLDADWIRDPGVRLEQVITPRTRAIHLWNECIKGFKEQPAPPGSFLARLQEEGAHEERVAGPAPATAQRPPQERSGAPVR
jgi:hypothetical protein